MIETIAARKKSEFVDPFGIDEEKNETSEEIPEPVNAKQPSLAKGKGGPNDTPVAVEEVDDGTFRYRLGKKQYRDSDKGDLGCLYKRPDVMPRLFFIRASFCNKLNAQMPHEELSHIGKSLKQFYITTGLGIAFLNDFKVDIYNI